MASSHEPSSSPLSDVDGHRKGKLWRVAASDFSSPRLKCSRCPVKSRRGKGCYGPNRRTDLWGHVFDGRYRTHECPVRHAERIPWAAQAFEMFRAFGGELKGSYFEATPSVREAFEVISSAHGYLRQQAKEETEG